MVDNSFFCQDMTGKKVMVLAPHQDDEIYMSGALIYSLNINKADIYVVYSTNGDYKFKAETRFSEAYNSLSILGIPQKNIIFLGFADGCLDDKHIFYADVPQKSLSGHVETYGVGEAKDFSKIYRHKHMPYTKEGFLNTLKDVILFIMPDIIFCVDHDTHWDHRMLSVSFDIVMGEILNEYLMYKPQIFKILAYATSYEAVPDFYRKNIKSVPMPKVGEVLGYDTNILEYSYYLWESRVRFPVLKKCRGRFKINNILFRAMCKHMSQGAAMHADYAINGDVVYWQRRTDNLAFSAFLSASSGNPEYVRDFRLYGIDDIDPRKKYIEFKDNMWIPNDGDNEREIVFSWCEPQCVEYIVIYGNINDTGCIKKIQVKCDNGTDVKIIPLFNKGRANVVKLSNTRDIRSLKLKILDAEGKYGLNQVEIFADKYQVSSIQPYVKITYNGDFIYDYWINKNIRELTFDIYRYACDDEIELLLKKQTYSEIKGNTLFINPLDDRVTILAKSRVNNKIYDEVEIIRKSKFDVCKLRIAQKIEYYIINFVLRRLKKYMYLRNKYIGDI